MRPLNDLSRHGSTTPPVAPQSDGGFFNPITQCFYVTHLSKRCSIPLETIAYFQAQDKYIELHTLHRNTFILSCGVSLKQLQALNLANFSLIHRKYLVNMTYASHLVKRGDTHNELKDLVLRNGAIVQVARRCTAQIRKQLRGRA